MLTLYGLSYWMGVCAKSHLSPWSFLPWRQTSLSDLLVLRMMFNSPICLPYMWYQNCRHAALFGANQSLTRRARSPGERCEASMKIYVPNTMKTLSLFTGNVSSTYVWNEFPNCFITYAGLAKLRHPWVYCAIQKTGNTLIWFWQINCILTSHTEGRKMRGRLKTTDLLCCCLRFSFLALKWRFSRYTTFHKHFWCSHFSGFHSNDQIKSDRLKCFQHLDQNVFKWDSNYQAVLKLIVVVA